MTAGIETTGLEEGNLIAGRYRIGRLLGAGGFSLVYDAERIDLKQRVALKILGSAGVSNSVSQRFMREARVLAKLRDPHTISILDFGTDNGRLFLVFEYIDGETLKETCDRKGGISEDRLKPMLIQILESLAEAHTLGIAHRDIKPDNIMLYDRPSRSDCIKVVDFGIAKTIETEMIYDSGITTDDSVVGTPRYMAPEQMMGEDLTPAADLYSLGLVCWYVIHGERPFEGISFNDMRRLKLSGGLPVDITCESETLQRFLSRCLQRDPKKRFLDAMEALAFLNGSWLTFDSSATDVSFPIGADPTGITKDRSLNSREYNLIDSMPEMFPEPSQTIVPTAAGAVGHTADQSRSEEIIVTRTSKLPWLIIFLLLIAAALYFANQAGLLSGVMRDSSIDKAAVPGEVKLDKSSDSVVVSEKETPQPDRAEERQMQIRASVISVSVVGSATSKAYGIAMDERNAGRAKADAKTKAKAKAKAQRDARRNRRTNPKEKLPKEKPPKDDGQTTTDFKVKGVE